MPLASGSVIATTMQARRAPVVRFGGGGANLPIGAPSVVIIDPGRPAPTAQLPAAEPSLPPRRTARQKEAFLTAMSSLQVAGIKGGGPASPGMAEVFHTAPGEMSAGTVPAASSEATICIPNYKGLNSAMSLEQPFLDAQPLVASTGGEKQPCLAFKATSSGAVGPFGEDCATQEFRVPTQLVPPKGGKVALSAVPVATRQLRPDEQLSVGATPPIMPAVSSLASAPAITLSAQDEVSIAMHSAGVVTTPKSMGALRAAVGSPVSAAASPVAVPASVAAEPLEIRATDRWINGAWSIDAAPECPNSEDKHLSLRAFQPQPLQDLGEYGKATSLELAAHQEAELQRIQQIIEAQAHERNILQAQQIADKNKELAHVSSELEQERQRAATLHADSAALVEARYAELISREVALARQNADLISKSRMQSDYIEKLKDEVERMHMQLSVPTLPVEPTLTMEEVVRPLAADRIHSAHVRAPAPRGALLVGEDALWLR